MDKFLPLFEGMEVDVASNKIILNGTPYTDAQFSKELPGVLDSSPLASELIALSVQDPSGYRKACLVITKALRKAVRDSEAAKKVEDPAVSGYSLENFEHLDWVRDIKTGQDFVVDMLHNKLTNIHPNALWACYTGAERKEMEKNFTRKTANCIFDPREKRTYYEKNGEYSLNKYFSPAWVNSENVAVPSRFLEFLHHLFGGDKVQMRFTLGWLYRLIHSRNETALVLNGAKGVGKNILYAVAKGLVGHDYCSEATKKFGVKEFNDIFRERILILIDEHQVNKEKYNFLKASFNEWQTIEAKGAAVKSTEKIYVNFMIFHNNPEDIYLEGEERRFSVMDITDTKLEYIWARRDIENFYKELNDPGSDLIAQIGNYITAWGNKNRDEVSNPFEVYMGAKYQEILDCHVNTIIHSIVDLIEKGQDDDGELTGPMVNTNCQRLLGVKMFCKGPRARSLVREYKYLNKYSLGEVITSTMPWKLKINPEVLELIETQSEED